MTTPNFNRIARLYALAEYLTLGPLLQRTRTHFLPQLAATRHAALFGDGDGRFTARLLATHPAIDATAVDTSATMLALLSNRCRFALPRLTTAHADALTHTCLPTTDLIVTHFFLDCLTQPQVDAFITRTAEQISPQALWLLSDFRIPTAANPLWRTLTRLYIRALYIAFRILTGLRVTHLPDPQSALRRAGFHCLASHSTLAGLLYTELWQQGAAKPASYNEPVPEPLHNPQDAQPDPEPAVPSLPAPDPGVFHYDPALSAPPIPKDPA